MMNIQRFLRLSLYDWRECVKMYLKGVQVKMGNGFTRVYMIVELTYVPPLANIWLAQIVGIDRHGELAKSFLSSVRSDEIFDDDVFVDGVQIDCMTVKEQVNAGKLTYLLPLEGIFEIKEGAGRFFMRFIDNEGRYRFDFDENNAKRYEILSFEQVFKYFKESE